MLGGDVSPALASERFMLPTDRMVVLPGEFQVRLREQGPPESEVLLLLHGSGSSLETWDSLSALFAGRYRLLAIDLPGHGLTGPDPQRDYSPARFAEVLDAVLDSVGVRSATIVGNSMGGWVAWNYARLRPTRVHRLVLIDAYGAPNQARVRLPFAFRLARWPIARNALLVCTPRSSVRSSLMQSVADPASIDDATVERTWLLLRRAGNRLAMLDHFATLQPNATADEMLAIRAPTLIVWGRRDQLIPWQNGAWFPEHIPDAKLVVLEEVGHLAMEESPWLVFEALSSFIEGGAHFESTPTESFVGSGGESASIHQTSPELASARL
jgi:pimeloyl-ACP methyl ester carboxylesterase